MSTNELLSKKGKIMRDLVTILFMGIFILLGIYGANKNEKIPFKIGSIISSLAICDGLAYFGWEPYFGGTNHSPSVYFGCIMLTFGILSWLTFFGLSHPIKKEK